MNSIVAGTLSESIFTFAAEDYCDVFKEKLTENHKVFGAILSELVDNMEDIYKMNYILSCLDVSVIIYDIRFISDKKVEAIMSDLIERGYTSLDSYEDRLTFGRKLNSVVV